MNHDDVVLHTVVVVNSDDCMSYGCGKVSGNDDNDVGLTGAVTQDGLLMHRFFALTLNWINPSLVQLRVRAKKRCIKSPS